MLIQRSNVKWFYDSRSLLYFYKEIVLLYYYASVFISCSVSVMVHSIFYASMGKHFHLTAILSHKSIFSAESLLY